MDELFVRTEYEDSGKPPRSKKLIAVCSWAWGPAHSRSEYYYLSCSRDQKEWQLWSKPGDVDLGTFWFNPVLLRVQNKILIREAARRLITEAWKAEWKAYNSPGPGVSAATEGILNQSDLEEISKEAFGELE